jgi:hypothetical protein
MAAFVWQPVARADIPAPLRLGGYADRLPAPASAQPICTGQTSVAGEVPGERVVASANVPDGHPERFGSAARYLEYRRIGCAEADAPLRAASLGQQNSEQIDLSIQEPNGFCGVRQAQGKRCGFANRDSRCRAPAVRKQEGMMPRCYDGAAGGKPQPHARLDAGVNLTSDGQGRYMVPFHKRVDCVLVALDDLTESA